MQPNSTPLTEHLSPREQDYEQNAINAEPLIQNSESSATQQQATNENEPDSYRWIILGCLFCNIIASCMFMNSMSTIVMELAFALEKEPIVINLLTLIFIFLFIPMSLLSGRINRMVYPDTILRICSVVTIAMANLRFLFNAYDNFWCLIVPSIITAFCQAPVFSCIAQVPALWFPQNQQGIATGICGLGISLGGIVAFSLPAIFITGNEDQILPATHELIRMQACLMTSLSLVSLLFMKEKPKNLPSPQAQILSDRIEQHRRGDGLAQVKLTINCNQNISLICVFFVGLYSLQLILSVIVGQLLRPYYTAVEVSIIGVCLIVFGLFGNIGFGFLLDKYRDPMPLAKVQSFCTMIASLYMWCVIKTGSLFFAGLGAAALGFFMIPALPVGFQLAIRLEKPESPAAYTGLLMMCMYLWSLSISCGLAFIADTYQQTIFGFFALSTFVAFSSTWFISSAKIKEEFDNNFSAVHSNPKLVKEV